MRNIEPTVRIESDGSNIGTWGKWRKKPVIIEAIQLPFAFEVKTLEGVMRGNAGDWLIRGVQGELYPCKADIFAATYEPVIEPPKPVMRGE